MPGCAASPSRCYFNSRPSARGDAIDILDCIPNLFQFTPLREGRRRGRFRRIRLQAISIHAPPRGATGGQMMTLGSLFISIHAPPRGATRTACARRQCCYFNSRPSARGDGHPAHPPLASALFQFPPLREGRQQKICNFCKSFVQPSQITAL